MNNITVNTQTEHREKKMYVSRMTHRFDSSAAIYLS